MKLLKWLVLGLVSVGLLAVAGAVWLVGTQSGLRWALGFVPDDIVLEAPRGALVGTISFERIAFQGSEARHVSFQVNLRALLANTISVEFIRIVSLSLAKPGLEKASEPSTLFPFRVRVVDAQVKSVVYEGYEIHDLSAEYSGGASRHEAQITFSGAGARASVKAAFGEQISVAARIQGLNVAVLHPGAPQTSLDLMLEGKGSTTAFAGKLSVTNPQPGPIDRERLPFERLEAALSTDMKTVVFEPLQATAHGGGVLTGKGAASLEGADLDLRIANLDLRSIHSSLRETRLAGDLDLELAADRQRVKVSVSQEDMSLTADAERRGDDVEIRSLRARTGDSEATGSARLHLGDPLRFATDLRLARFNPARFGDYPEGSINGTLKASGDLGGRGTARWQIAESRLFGEALASAGSAELVKDRIAKADAWATLGKNRATARGSFGGPRDELAWTAHIPDISAITANFAGEIRARGTVRGSWKEPRAVISAEASGLRLTEALTFNRVGVNVSGGLEHHEADVTASNNHLDLRAKLRGGWRDDAWRGEILSAANAGDYPFELKTPATLEAAAERVGLGGFQAELAGARASVESVRWEDHRLTSGGRITGLAARWIAALAKIDDKIVGDLTLDAEWDLAATPKLNGQVRVRRASGDLALGDTALGLSQAQMQARFKDDSVEAKAEVASRLGSAKAEATVAGLTRDSALRATAEVEAAELRSLTEPLFTQARISGRVTASLRIAGTIAAPEVSGVLRGDVLGVEMPPWGVSYQDGRVRANLEANRLVVTEARIASGEGEFTASGTLALGGEAATTLSWEAKQFRALGRPDRRLIASGKGVASFDGKRFGLKGELRADSGHFEIATDSLQQLDDDVEVVGAPHGEVRVARKQGPLPLDLDLRLDLGSRLTLRAYGYNGGLSGQLRVSTGPAGELLAQGRVEAVKATFYAYGQALEVDPGSVIFGGPISNPALEITAWRRHQQVEAGLRLTGTVQTPRVQLVSNPAVGENEKLSWLVLGRAPSEAGGADLAVLQAAGGAVLGRGGDEPLNRRFARRFGFDELTVRGSSQLQGNVVALGKRWSDDVYVSFEQAISTTTEYLVKLDYALTQRFSLRGQTGTTSSVGVFYRFSWD
ncbi:MAG TPA: translocation/assembly module TamB domain-containing protein [Burkholderiales bacterium]|nr:translocation/assembly module TamB domain-containing protein [Burkholderiales bacterium]